MPPVRFVTACLSAGMAFVLSFPGAAEAGISYNSLTASSDASAVLTPGQPAITDSDSTSGGVPVTPDTLLLQVNAMVGDANTVGGAGNQGLYNAQQSRLTSNSVLYARPVDSQGARAEGSFQATFTLDQRYIATRTIQLSPGTPFAGSVSGLFSAVLTTEEGLTVFDEQSPTGDIVNETSSPFLLLPGTYNFATSSELIAEDENAIASGEYSFWIDLAPVDDGPTAIPLPPAAWMGLAMLGGLAVKRYRQSRRNA